MILQTPNYIWNFISDKDITNQPVTIEYTVNNTIHHKTGTIESDVETA